MHNEPRNTVIKRPCDECGTLAELRPIYDQYNSDVIKRLCRACDEARQARRDAMERGD